MRDAVGLVFWIVVCLSVGVFGAQFFDDVWYAELRKPPLNPPAWVFPPVWTTLYVLISLAAWRIWRRKGFAPPWAVLFAAQLLLNGLWSWLFFGLHRPDWALADVVLLESLLVAMLWVFVRNDRLAGALLVPYVLWVGFAAYLNFALWRLNP